MMPLPAASWTSLFAKLNEPTWESGPPIWYAVPFAGTAPCHAPVNTIVLASLPLTTLLDDPALTRRPAKALGVQVFDVSVTEGLPVAGSVAYVPVPLTTATN